MNTQWNVLPIATLLAATLLAATLTTAVTADEPAHRQLSEVPFTQVKFQDTFWAPRLQINREKSIPHNFKWCEETGRFSNFAKAAGLQEGKFEGIYFNDSDVYKVLEGASYSLADHPDPQLERMTDEVIAKIAAAQRDNGYLNTYYTLVEPGKEWTDCKIHHELYCAGHLIEAAVAHYRATGKRTLLDVALRFADCIDGVFGPGKRADVPGHEELELALVKLYEVTGQQKYLGLSNFFLQARGNKQLRPELYGHYFQDHCPVVEQSEIVGHAVRAMYLYSGVADMAAYNGEAGYIAAMDRLWQDVVQRKMYITGGIGARHEGEAFGDPYELPNDSAYCETCAAIGLALWSHRLNLLHADAHYADVMERVIYNGILAGIGMDGEHFFYVNPLASAGNHHRQPFYPCACCPTNVVRFLPSLPGYVYALTSDDIYVNLYVAGQAQVTLQGKDVTLHQETNYPWDGDVVLKIDASEPFTCALRLRIPQWCRTATVSIQGQQQPLNIERGYAVLHRQWTPGETVRLQLPMDVVRMEAHPLVSADWGRVALQRGPLVYCVEAVDNGGRVNNLILPREPEFSTDFRQNLLGGIEVVRAPALGGLTLTAIPYYAWDHRDAGAMNVWIRQDGKSRHPRPEESGWQGILYRPLDPATLGASVPLSLMDQVQPSASHCYSIDTVAALADTFDPRNSNDQAIPRFTWWDHRGTSEWVQYDLDAPATIRSAAVYWFDDEPQGGCRTPESWKLLYRQGNEWKPVSGISVYPVEKDRFNRVNFDPVTTSALRLEVQLKSGFSGGILQWNVE